MDRLQIKIFIDDREWALRYWSFIPRIGDNIYLSGITAALQIEDVIWRDAEQRPTVELYCKTIR